MSEQLTKPCTAFIGQRLLAAGPLIDVACAVKVATEGGTPETVLAFDDATGAVVDFDLRGSKSDIAARIAGQADRASASTETEDAASSKPVDDGDVSNAPRGRGRPRLGVVAREVTLLPRHWDWLAVQRGGASVALRRLVEDARRAGGGDNPRKAQETAYRFMSALAGDLPDFEEATRALFAGRTDAFEERMSNWPADVRSYALKLANPAKQDISLSA